MAKSNIRIYQGNQIGGCVTVISTEAEGKIHRIMIDYGCSLEGSKPVDEFEYPWESEPIDAVFFTHYHGDHVGRLMEIPKQIPLYMGETARKILINVQTALAAGSNEAERKTHQEELELLKDDSRIRTFHWNGRSFDAVEEIPGFRIEPYSVDHSAYDAYMFLIEVADTGYEGGKKVILHTGDFRGHGRRGKAMLPMIQKYVHKNGRQVHSLITEGTMMSRQEEQVMTETEMMLEAVEYLKKHKYVFLICSSTNLDSLASFYQAAQIAAKPYEQPLYVYNGYFKKQLETFSETAGQFSDVYRFTKVYQLDLDKELKSSKWTHSMTQKELMEKTGFLAIVKPEMWCDKFVNPFVQAAKEGRIDQMPVILYSMWRGYVEENHPAKKENWIAFLKAQKEQGVEVRELHTSGHADVGMLVKAIEAVAPTEEIWPMHTQCPELFAELAIGEDLKKRIKYS